MYQQKWLTEWMNEWMGEWVNEQSNEPQVDRGRQRKHMSHIC